MALFRKGVRRGPPTKPDLDGLLTLVGAVPALQSAVGLASTGVASICVRPADTAEPTDPVDMSGIAPYEESTDSFGFAWLTRRGTPGELPGLIKDIQAIGGRLDTVGFGSSLLCTLVAFSDGKAPTVALVYSYKRGTWYPFAPTGENTRDSIREMQIKDHLDPVLKIEQDLSRWFPIWGAPGL